jgi:hypothetical protein
MKKQTTLFIALCVICCLFYRCSNNSTTNAPATNDSSVSASNNYGGYASQAEWGGHLVTICGCNDCHTPKKMTDHGPDNDSSLLLSGHPSQISGPSLKPEQLAQGMVATNDLTAWIGPWGISYAANLTPDSTGLGSWSEEQFMTCIRQGLFKGLAGSRSIVMPMPIMNFKNMTDDELKAIFAYLKTKKPIHNVVADYQPPVGGRK